MSEESGMWDEEFEEEGEVRQAIPWRTEEYDIDFQECGRKGRKGER